MMRYTLSDFDYALPPELIAQVPAPERAGSRLLHVDGATLADLAFADLPRLLARGDLVVFNDTRVIKARLRATRPTGGKVELLLERALARGRGACSSFARAIRRRPGGELLLPGGARATVRRARRPLLPAAPRRRSRRSFDYLERHGEVPLPPYIARAADAADAARYQTVYARHAGRRGRADRRPALRRADARGARGRRRRVGVRHAARRRRHVPAGRDRGPRRAPDARRVVPDSGRDRRRDRSGARARRPRSSPSARPACARSSRRPTTTGACAPAKRRRGSSSRRATASASSTGCSPTSICRNRRC